MKVSFVSTVLNEEGSIYTFLQSIANQTKIPDEVIIVDAGSTDKTLSVISNFKFPISNKKIKIITKKGNRSVGRNEAIKHACGDIIAVSDAGCILDKHWLEKITNSFTRKNIAVVSGYYYPITKNIFQKCLAAYTCVMPDKINPKNFLPSSRSIAFRKKVWGKVGGYPEYLNYCEDLVFDKKLKQANMQFVFNKNAFVYWPQRENILQAFLQFFQYATGDGEALYIRQQTPFLFVRYTIEGVFLFIFFTTGKWLFGLIVLSLLFLYLSWAVIKNYQNVRDWKAVFFLPLLQVVSDIAVICGMIYGMGRSFLMKKSSLHKNTQMI